MHEQPLPLLTCRVPLSPARIREPQLGAQVFGLDDFSFTTCNSYLSAVKESARSMNAMEYSRHNGKLAPLDGMYIRPLRFDSSSHWCGIGASIQSKVTQLDAQCSEIAVQWWSDH